MSDQQREDAVARYDEDDQRHDIARFLEARGVEASEANVEEFYALLLRRLDEQRAVVFGRHNAGGDA